MASLKQKSMSFMTFSFSAIFSVFCAGLIHTTGGFSLQNLLLGNGAHNGRSNKGGNADQPPGTCVLPDNLTGYDYIMLGPTRDPVEDDFIDLEPLNISFILQPIAGVTANDFQEVIENCIISARTLGENVTDEIYYETYIHGVLYHLFRIGCRGYNLESRVNAGNTGRICDFVLDAKPQIGNHSFIIKVTTTDKPIMLRSAAEAGLMLMEKEDWARELMKDKFRINHVFLVSIAFQLDDFFLEWSNETIFRPHPSIKV